MNQSVPISERMRKEGLSEEKVTILQMILEEMEKGDPKRPMNLLNVERSRVRRAVAEANEVIGFIEAKTITETNRLLNAAAVVVGRCLGITRATKKNGGTMVEEKDQNEDKTTKTRHK